MISAGGGVVVIIGLNIAPLIFRVGSPLYANGFGVALTTLPFSISRSTPSTSPSTSSPGSSIIISLMKSGNSSISAG